MTQAAYTIHNINAYVGDKVTVSKAPEGLRWDLEYSVSPWGYKKPLMQDIPVGEYIVAEKISDTGNEGSAVSYVLKAA